MIHDPSSLTVVDYLKYKLSWVENYFLVVHLRGISEYVIMDFHLLKLMLQRLKLAVLRCRQYVRKLLPTLVEEICSLITNCKLALRDSVNLCRKINQTLQRIYYEKKYDKLISAMKEFIKQFPVGKIAQKAVTMVVLIIPYCDDELLMMSLEGIQKITPDYHQITLLMIPYLDLSTKFHKQITSSLLNGSPDI